MKPIRDGACGAERPLRIAMLPEKVGGSSAGDDRLPGGRGPRRAGRSTPSFPRPGVFSTAARSASWSARPTSAGARTGWRATRLSEHGFANGVDIGGIVFDGGKPHAVMPLSGEALDGRFQAEIQARACAYFSTVLGPGSDAAHANHFHFDLRGRQGGFRICQ